MVPRSRQFVHPLRSGSAVLQLATVARRGPNRIGGAGDTGEVVAAPSAAVKLRAPFEARLRGSGVHWEHRQVSAITGRRALAESRRAQRRVRHHKSRPSRVPNRTPRSSKYGRPTNSCASLTVSPQTTCQPAASRPHNATRSPPVSQTRLPAARDRRVATTGVAVPSVRTTRKTSPPVTAPASSLPPSLARKSRAAGSTCPPPHAWAPPANATPPAGPAPRDRSPDLCAASAPRHTADPSAGAPADGDRSALVTSVAPGNQAGEAAAVCSSAINNRGHARDSTPELDSTGDRQRRWLLPGAHRLSRAQPRRPLLAARGGAREDHRPHR